MLHADPREILDGRGVSHADHHRSNYHTTQTYHACPRPASSRYGRNTFRVVVKRAENGFAALVGLFR